MQEWWTYSLSDFLLFSPRTYYRLLERHNLALWPAHIVALLLAAVIAALLRRPGTGSGRTIAAVLAAMWAWTGWAFVAVRYATINWAAPWLAALFAAEVLLLAGVGVAKGAVRFRWRRDAGGLVGGALFLGSVALYPLLGPALGRGWAQAEVFGIAPDPTVLGTLGLLMLAEGPRRARVALLVAPVAWCVLSGVTLLAMGSPETWILLPLAGLVIVLGATESREP